MRLEVINTGSELLLGHVVNTHLSFLGESLFPLGLRIQRQTTVPDGDIIAQVLRESLERADCVIVTGGLGPTSDDITRDLVAAMFNLPLELDDYSNRDIEAKLASRGMVMNENVRRQAMVPKGGSALKNLRGTAPGLYFPPAVTGGKHVFLLPGPPRELRPMFEEEIVPILRAVLPPATTGVRVLRLVGQRESEVELAVGDAILALGEVELGYCARMGEVDVRVIAAPPLLDRAEAIVREKFAASLVSTDGTPIDNVLLALLRERGATLALAESCTGGALANRLTSIPGISEVFLAGYVTYANSAKQSALGVPAALIEAHGAVSEQVALAMAEGALRVSGATLALATTGIAGPGGGTPEKPVGTVFVALADASGPSVVHRHHYPADRETFKYVIAQKAFEMLRRRLLGAH